MFVERLVSLLVSLSDMTFGLDGCHLFSFCVTRCRRDIDSILHLVPAAIGQCFWRSIISPSDVRRANLLVELLLLWSGILPFF